MHGSIERERANFLRGRTAAPGSAQAVARRIVIGTSSWADPGSVEEWYPKGLPARERLPY